MPRENQGTSFKATILGSWSFSEQEKSQTTASAITEAQKAYHSEEEINVNGNRIDFENAIQSLGADDTKENLNE